MKVKVKDIVGEGLDLERTLKAEELALTEIDCKFRSPLKITAHLDKATDEVIAKVAVDGTYAYECARCLEPVTVSRHDKFITYFDITPETELVDLGDEIRQEMVLALTVIPLCKKDCKGICPQCGANLNKEKCKCDPASQGPRPQINIEI